MTGVLGKGGRMIRVCKGKGWGVSLYSEVCSLRIFDQYLPFIPQSSPSKPPTRSVKLDQDDSNNWLKLWTELGWIQWSISVFVTGVCMLSRFQQVPLMSVGIWHHKSIGEVTSSKMSWNLFSPSAFIPLRMFLQTLLNSPWMSCDTIMLIWNRIKELWKWET